MSVTKSMVQKLEKIILLKYKPTVLTTPLSEEECQALDELLKSYGQVAIDLLAKVTEENRIKLLDKSRGLQEP